MVSAAFVALVPIVALVLILRLHPRRRGKPSECACCGKPIPPRKVHTLVDRPTDPLEAQFAAWGGGSGVSQDRCPAHCDGTCGRRRCRGKLAA